MEKNEVAFMGDVAREREKSFLNKVVDVCLIILVENLDKVEIFWVMCPQKSFEIVDCKNFEVMNFRIFEVKSFKTYPEDASQTHCF